MRAWMPLRIAIALSVVAGLVLPVLYNGWQTLRYQRQVELTALRQDQVRMANTLALGLVPLLWNLDRPNVAQLAASMLQDSRVLRIQVNDSSYLGLITELKAPRQQQGERLSLRVPIRSKNEVIGTLLLEMDTGQVEERLARDFRQFLINTGAQLATSLLLILFLLEQRFVRPLRRLRSESVALAERRLDSPFVWERGDELGELGQSLESTRKALHRAFGEIEDKAYALEADIAHRKQVELALRTSEGRFRSLLALSSDGYWEQDAQFCFTQLGESVYQSAGLCVADDLGCTRWGLSGLAEPNEAGWLEHRAALEEHQSFRGFEYGRINSQGELRYFSVSGEPVYDAEATFCGYRGTVQNITARKETEVALRQALREQQTLLDNALVGIEFLKGWVIQRCNRGWEEMLGYDPGELNGQSTRLYHASDEDYDARVAAAYWVMAMGRAATGEIQLIRKDGSRIWCSFHGKPLDPDDPPNGMIWVYQDITERKRAEQALTESEARFRSLTALSADWYWETDEQDRFTLLSPNFRERTGADPDHILGKMRHQLAGVRYLSDRWEYYQAQVAARLPFHDLEYQLDQPDSQVQYGSDSGEPIWDAQGNFRGYRGIGRDLTEGRQAEAARKSEIRLRRLVEHLPTGAIYIENDSLLLNQAAERLTGYTRDEITSVEQWFDVLAGEEATARRRWYEEDRAAGFHEPRVARIWRKDGEVRVIEFAVYADEYGEVWLAHDITEREAAEAALRQTLLEQQIILENAMVGIAFMKDRRILRCNHSMEHIYGYAKGELIGKNARILQSSEEAFQAVGSAAYPLIASGQTFACELQNRRKDGSQVWISLQGKAVDHNDLDKGVVWVNQDITARKEAEYALAAANERLEAGMSELGQLNRDVMLLSELSSLLQACQSTDEAHAAIGAYGTYLFPNDAGVFFMMDTISHDLYAVASWGDGVSYPVRFTSEHCWALRRGQLYKVEQPAVDLTCDHVAHPQGQARPYACIPLVAQGETLGLLYLEHRAANRFRPEAHLRLASALAEQTALALANIRLRQTLQQQSIRDVLTGLYNRRYLEQAMQRELARAVRKQGEFAVAIVDVDHFKLFNDTFGHDAGDMVLQAVAAILQSTVREGDVVCRYGGEEFVLLLVDIPAAAAFGLVGRILEVVRALDLYHGSRPLGHITVSLGFALYPVHGQAASTLIEAADAALYQAKRSGRNRFVVAQDTAL